MNSPSHQSSSSSSSAPKLWIAVSAVLAIAVIGLAIWGFSQKSDLDDANAKISSVQTSATSAEDAEKAENTHLEGLNEREAKRFRAVKAKLIKEDKQAEDFKQQVTNEANALQEAQNALAAAKTEAQKAEAQSNVHAAASRAAIACAQATVNAIDAFDTEGGGANNPSGAAETAMNRLESVAEPCQTVLSDSNGN